MNYILPGQTAVWTADTSAGVAIHFQADFGHWRMGNDSTNNNPNTWTHSELSPGGWTVTPLTQTPGGNSTIVTAHVTAPLGAPPYDPSLDYSPALGPALLYQLDGSAFTAGFLFKVLNPNFGICVDRNGVVFSAVPDGVNLIRIYRIAGAIGDKQEIVPTVVDESWLHGVSEIDSPAMCVDDRNRKYLLVRRDGNWLMLRSRDDCRTWRSIAMSAPWPTGYMNADPAHRGTAGLHGGFGSIAVETATSKLWFRTSGDGQNWSLPAILVNTVAAPAQYRLVFVESTAQWIITDGVSTQYSSVDGGRNWDPW